ncbi:hypothetical protein Vadar_006305 [Vaccinium darrowii]|uniref:Uncharacterized protein n=1 Tax=Vaccinium darrowii TaxID=229202 RepID=A0ACB7YTW1_9ERIC|nr:hypothetical protein Vadar_006305 [Vaccinium darrowii]
MEVAIKTLVEKGFLEQTLIQLVITPDGPDGWTSNMEYKIINAFDVVENIMRTIEGGLRDMQVIQMTSQAFLMSQALKSLGLGKVERTSYELHQLLYNLRSVGVAEADATANLFEEFREDFRSAQEKLTFYFKGLLGLKFIELESVSRQHVALEVTSTLQDVTTLVAAMEEKLKRAKPDFRDLYLDTLKLVLASSRMGADMLMKSCNDFIKYFLQENFVGCRETFPRMKEEGKVIGLYLYRYFMELGMPFETTLIVL